VVLPEVARPAARHQIPIRVVVVLREWFNVVQGHRGQEPDAVVAAVVPQFASFVQDSAAEQRVDLP